MMKRWCWLLTWVCVLFPLWAPASNLEEDFRVKEFRGGLSGITILDLDTAKRIALSQNPNMAAARARVEQAGQRVRQAEAAYWPRLEAGGAASYVGISDSERESQLQLYRFFDPQAQMDKSMERYSVGLTASWTLFDGFAREFTLQAEKMGEMQQKEAHAEAQRFLLTSVSATFFNAQLAKENITIAREDETFNERQVADAEIRLRVGTGALSDVLNFKVQANTARSRVNSFTLEYRRLLIGLAALMGVSDAGFPEALSLSPLAPEMETEMFAPDTRVLIADALAHRPDLQQSDYKIKQAEARIQLARSELFPKFNLFADLSGKRDNSIRFEEDDFGYSMGINMTYPIFTGGAREARIREAAQASVEARQIGANLSINVASEVRQAIEEVSRAREELKLQRANASLVAENRDLVEKEYAAGQGTLVRLNEAQRDLVAAQSRLAASLVSLRKAWQNLDSATGRILQVPAVDVTTK